MKKIAVFGLEELNNFGENFLIDCACYLLGNRVRSIICNVEPVITKPFCYFYNALVMLSNASKNLDRVSGRLMYEAVKLRCGKTYDRAISDADALIFAMGSFKYGTQKIWAYFSLGIDIAEKYHVPVMISGVNVQEYKDMYKSRVLKDHLNNPNVKLISVRDGERGIKRLKEGYKMRTDIKSLSVGDLAFWIPECYDVARNTIRDVIGINLINSRNLIAYNSGISEEELLDLYVFLLRQLDKRGIKWQLFTNGMPKDREFGVRVLREYGNEEIDIIVPGSKYDLIELICSCRAIFGARLHAMITAYSMDVPFVGFSWDAKISDFAKTSDLEDIVFDSAHFDKDKILEKLLNIYFEGYMYNIEVRNRLKEQTKEAIDGFVSSLFL